MTAQTDMFNPLSPGGEEIQTADPSGMAAREAALSLLGDIFSRKKMLDAALEGSASFAALPVRDRAFARMMVATVLRRRGQMEDLIARASAKGEAPRPEILRWILYLGLAQIVFMDVPDHAAVDTTVTLAERHNLPGKKGFVNALLRRIAGAEGTAWIAAQDDAALNIPPWIYDQWKTGYGQGRARDIARAVLTEAPLDLSLKDANAREDWARRLEADILPTGTLRRAAGGSVIALPGFSDGAWWVQDASSALPARLFGDVAGKRVLDLCAAPGGKTMQLAAMGAHVIALDRSAARMKTLNENLARTGLADKVKTVVEDGALWSPKEKFSFILLDAPCTATGTIRRHPDLLALKTEKDQAGLVSIQARLLENAAKLLESGGILIYCTCSLQKAEGEHQVQAFLRAHGAFRRLPIRREEYGNIDGTVTADGDVRVLPYHLNDQGGMDGFFIARLQKA